MVIEHPTVMRVVKITSQGLGERPKGMKPMPALAMMRLMVTRLRLPNISYITPQIGIKKRRKASATADEFPLTLVTLFSGMS